MSYELKPDERLSVGFKRIAREELDSALRHLRHAPEGRGKAIHEARKSSKKIRALLRLVRQPLRNERYRQENVMLRDGSRHLAAARDSEVLIETLDELLAHYNQLAGENTYAFDDLRALLVRRHKAEVRRTFGRKERRRAQAIAAFREVKGRVATWPLSDGLKPYTKGLRRIYQRGQAALNIALHDPTPHHLHDWRKSVKYLRHMAELLHPLSPEALEPFAKAMRDLGEELGVAHDVFVLHELVLSEPKLPRGKGQRARLLGLLHERQSVMESEALARGVPLFAATPDAFIAKLLNR